MLPTIKQNVYLPLRVQKIPVEKYLFICLLDELDDLRGKILLLLHLGKANK